MKKIWTKRRNVPLKCRNFLYPKTIVRGFLRAEINFGSYKLKFTHLFSLRPVDEPESDSDSNSSEKYENAEGEEEEEEEVDSEDQKD